MARPIQTLNGSIHVWLAEPEIFKRPDQVAACRNLLGRFERECEASFRFQRHAHTYLIAHALRRLVLGVYLDVEPGTLEFTRGPFGRPGLRRADGAPNLRFSLSHTDGLVAFGLVLDSEIGVDVERLDRWPTIAQIADTWFSDRDWQHLNEMDEAQKAVQFVNLWTLKEAYTKAVGRGMSLGFDSIAFQVLDHHRIVAEFSTRASGRGWQFQLFSSGRHRGAIAVCRLQGCESRSLSVRHVTAGFPASIDLAGLMS